MLFPLKKFLSSMAPPQPSTSLFGQTVMLTLIYRNHRDQIQKRRVRVLQMYIGSTVWYPGPPRPLLDVWDEDRKVLRVLDATRILSVDPKDQPWQFIWPERLSQAASVVCATGLNYWAISTLAGFVLSSVYFSSSSSSHQGIEQEGQDRQENGRAGVEGGRKDLATSIETQPQTVGQTETK